MNTSVDTAYPVIIMLDMTIADIVIFLPVIRMFPVIFECGDDLEGRSGRIKTLGSTV